MAHASRAWVMDVGAGWHMAAGAPHVVEYVLAADAVRIPQLPVHCVGLLTWRDRLIPLLDLRPLLAEAATPVADARRAVVLAYQEAPGQPLQYGALLVMAAPTDTWVSDDMATPLPETPASVRHLARACFVRQDQAIPIIDARRLFARPLPAALARAGGAVVAVVQSPGAVVAAPQTAESHLADVPIAAGAPAERAESGVCPVPDQDAGNEALNPAYCVVIPFASARGVADPEARVPAEPRAGDSGPAVAPAGGSATAGLSVDAGANADAPGGTALRAEIPRSSSSALQSFRRLHDAERRAQFPDRKLRGWGLLAAAITLAVLAAVLLRAAPWSTLKASVTRTAVTRDVAPRDIDPASAPAAPVQPPR